MGTKLTRSLKSLRKVLDVRQLRIIRVGAPNYIKRYQPLKETLAKAKRAGLSVGDYIDVTFQIPGATQATIDKMVAVGALGADVQTVCEIGPGSGRYLERVQKIGSIESYEIYETDKDWSQWLANTFDVTVHDADGLSLRDTLDCSVDLVHAHKVFVYLPSIVVCRYFGEMVRVVREGGKIVFDCMSETCMSDAILEKWIAAGIYYPCMMAREFVVSFFERRGCRFCTSFLAPMRPGESEYMVFEKKITENLVTDP